MKLFPEILEITLAPVSARCSCSIEVGCTPGSLRLETRDNPNGGASRSAKTVGECLYGLMMTTMLRLMMLMMLTTVIGSRMMTMTMFMTKMLNVTVLTAPIILMTRMTRRMLVFSIRMGVRLCSMELGAHSNVRDDKGGCCDSPNGGYVTLWADRQDPDFHLARFIHRQCLRPGLMTTAEHMPRFHTTAHDARQIYKS